MPWQIVHRCSLFLFFWSLLFSFAEIEPENRKREDRTGTRTRRLRDETPHHSFFFFFWKTRREQRSVTLRLRPPGFEGSLGVQTAETPNRIQVKTEREREAQSVELCSLLYVLSRVLRRFLQSRQSRRREEVSCLLIVTMIMMIMTYSSSVLGVHIHWR